MYEIENGGIGGVGHGVAAEGKLSWAILK